MTVYQLWQAMRAHIAADTLPTGCVDAGYATIRKALLELYKEAPSTFSTPRGVIIDSGATYSIGVTAGATALTGENAAWRNGSTLLVVGDTSYNQLYRRGDLTADFELLYPYTGSTGTVSAQVWNDVVTLADTVDTVIKATLPDITRNLQVATSYEDYMGMQSYWQTEDYGSTHGRFFNPGMPRGCWLETITEPGATPQKILHIAPLPQGQFRLRLEVIHGGQPNIDAGGVALLASETNVQIKVPTGWDVQYLQPIALQLWTSSAWFSNEKVRGELARQYAVAIDGLKTHRSMTSGGSSLIMKGY